MWQQASLLAVEGGILPPGTDCDALEAPCLPWPVFVRGAFSAGLEARLYGRHGCLTATSNRTHSRAVA